MSIMKKIVVLIVFAVVLTVPGFGYCRGDGDHKTQPVNQNININNNNNINNQNNIQTNIQINSNNGNSFPGVPGDSCHGGHEFGGNGFGWFEWVGMPAGIVTGGLVVNSPSASVNVYNPQTVIVSIGSGPIVFVTNQ